MTNAETPDGRNGIKEDASARRGAGGRGRAAALAALVVAGGAAALYGMTLDGGKHVAHAGMCARSLDAAAAIDPLVRGEVAALALAKAPHDLSAIGFNDAGGGRTTLASFKGRTVLLNLWATWCVPCRAEMPALDRLQTEMGSPAFTIVPVDVDQSKLERARGFFKEIGTNSLPYYADPSADILRALAAKGLPTTVLVGADGCEIATLAGPAQWDSGDAKAVIARAVETAGAKPPG